MAVVRRASSAADDAESKREQPDIARSTESRERTGVPVPWRDEGDRPYRTPPDKDAPAVEPDPGEDLSGASGRPIEDGPLLSAEEIRTLLYERKSTEPRSSESGTT